MDDLDRFRAAPDGERLKPPKVRGLLRHKPGEWFLRGPIPGKWLSKSATLTGSSLHVALAVWYLAGLKRSPQVTLTRKTLLLFGVLPDAGRRGLIQLERAGLVSVERAPGSSPRVTLLDPTHEHNGED